LVIPDNKPYLSGSFLKQANNIMADDQKKSLIIYWKRNLRYLTILLIIWAVVSFGFGIFLKDYLDNIRIGGFKLGFWFAQQGSIYVFVILIFVYVGLMNKLDREFDVDEK
jgi:putative solute:sodium symporter small subunit